jgi:CheY-like chemotaxis protein
LQRNFFIHLNPDVSGLSNLNLYSPMNQEKTVMIVDDEPASVKLFQEALKETNNQSNCHVAVDGKDAFDKLKTLKEGLPELIFLDLNMPRMNGR